MPQKQESDTEDRKTRETRSPTRAKVKKTNSFQTFSNIGVKLFTKYRKSHTINGATDASSVERAEANAKKRQKDPILRRPSWRKLTTHIRKFAHQVTNTKQDRVPPINGYVWPPNATPGVVGLRNHGNTCFMNAVLQCLSHTDLLAEYFVLDLYKADLKRRNKINSKKFGTKGELTEQLGLVLKALWTCKDVSEYSSSFKAVVDRYGAQFRQNSQHDAQEFLFWLLDKVHEDLNTANKRKYKLIKNTNGRPDEDLAAETLANHRRCNNSFVQAVFQAQFRSSLTCPRCQKQSNTFDPFHCISVQLPQLTHQSVFLKVIYALRQPKQVKLGIGIPHGSSVILLRDRLVHETQLPSERIILTEIGDTGFNRILCDSHPLSSVSEIDPIYCIEAPKLAENTPHILLLIANVKHLSSDSFSRFGTIFCLQVARDISFLELQKTILKEMKTVLKPEVFAYKTPLHEMFRIHLIDPSADSDTYIEATVEHPLFTEMIDMALSVFPTDAGPAHIKLLLEWPAPELYFADLEDHWVEHESVAKLQTKPAEISELTLDDCLDHYTKAETLSAEDAWRCPNCQKYLPVVKTLGLWSLPDILVIHFKRFRQHVRGTSANAAKLTTMVDFPLVNFDMSKHLARDSMNSTSPTKKGEKNRYQVPSSHQLNFPKDHKYDLYAVCYHQGDTLETGHYTASCKNPYDHQWYKFDDQKVTHVQNEHISDEIVNNGAYMLFYQRRRSDGSDCSAASSSSSEHWVSRILADPLTYGTTTKSSTLKSTVSMCASGEPTDEKDVNIADCLLDKTDEDVKIVESEQKVIIETIEEDTTVDDAIKSEAQIENNRKQSNQTKFELESLSELLQKNEENESIKGTTTDEKTIIKSEPVQIPISQQNGYHHKNLPSEEPKASSLPPTINSEIHPIHENGDDFVVFRDKNIIRATSLSTAKLKATPSTTKRSLVFSDVIIHTEHHSMPNSFLSRHSECIDTMQMIRGANSCSKDTLLFIDQSHQNLSHNYLATTADDDSDDDLLEGQRSLWISPVTPHKLITVSPKN